MLTIFAYSLETQFFSNFMVHLIAATVGFNFVDFVNFEFLGFLPHFVCHPVLLKFLGTELVMDLVYPLGYWFDHFCIFSLH